MDEKCEMRVPVGLWPKSLIRLQSMAICRLFALVTDVRRLCLQALHPVAVLGHSFETHGMMPSNVPDDS